MGSGFVTNGSQRAWWKERDRLVFMAAAGLALSLLVVMVLMIRRRQGDLTTPTETVAAPVAAPLSTVTLLVPSRAVRSGERLSDVPMKEIIWPRNQLPDGALRDGAELVGFYAKLDIPAGLPLQKIHLMAEPMNATLSVTPGNRAVTIEVDATSGLEGLALPGTRVDVVLTYFEQGELTSKVIVQNARVLASGADTAPAAQRAIYERRGGPVAPARTVTLDVSTRDSLRISTARQLGRLSLTMRAADDNRVSPEVEVSANQVGGDTQKRPLVETEPTSACMKGHFRVNGKQYQLNCDGSRVEVNE